MNVDSCPNSSRHGIPPGSYECPNCHKVFTRKYSMVRHQKTSCQISKRELLDRLVDMNRQLQEYQASVKEASRAAQPPKTIHKTVVKNVFNNVVNHVEDRYYNAVFFFREQTDGLTGRELMELIKKKCPNVPWTNETILKITYPDDMPSCSIAWVYEPDFRKMEPAV